MEEKKKSKSETRQTKAARSSLVAMLEEEQERERERESFWREQNTQARSEEEKEELLSMFEREREEAANNIVQILPFVIGRERTMDLVTSMEVTEDGHAQGGVATAMMRQQEERRQYPLRAFTPTFSDSGWLGGSTSRVEDDGGEYLGEEGEYEEEEERSGSEEEEEEKKGQFEQFEQLPTISTSKSAIASVTVGAGRTRMGGSSSSTDAHLPSLLPFAHHVLETEDEIQKREEMPLYKRNHVETRREKQKREDEEKRRGERRETRLRDRVDEVFASSGSDSGDGEVSEDGSPIRGARERRNARQIRYIKKKATKKITRDAQNKRKELQMRARPRQLATSMPSGEVMMVSVLDDGWQDNIPKVIPDMTLRSLQDTMVEVSEGFLTKPTPTVTTGMFWGPSLSVVGGGNGGSEGTQWDGQQGGSSSGGDGMAGGGAFWGSSGALVGERRTTMQGIEDVSDDEEEEESRNGGGESGNVEGGEGEMEEITMEQKASERSWQRRRRLWIAEERKRAKRRTRFTPYVCRQMNMKTRVKRRRGGKEKEKDGDDGTTAAWIDCTDRAPLVGGIGSLNAHRSSKGTKESRKNHLRQTPMLTAGCRLPGSINNGRGEYAVVTVISKETPSIEERGNVSIRGYLPRTGHKMELELTRDEVQFLLGSTNQARTQNDNLITSRSILLASSRRSTGRLGTGRIDTGRTTGRSSSRDEEKRGIGKGGGATKSHLLAAIDEGSGISTDYLDASEVQDYGASLKYMRPYWKAQVGPLLSRLEIHSSPVGGDDFATRVPTLQLDRCILSRTRYKIAIHRDQEYMSKSFPANTHTCTLIVRLERNKKLGGASISSSSDATGSGSPSRGDEDEDHLARLKEMEESMASLGAGRGMGKRRTKGENDNVIAASKSKPSELLLSCTVVFRGTGYGLGGPTCRCVLPFEKMSERLRLNDREEFENPMGVVRRGRRDDLIESVLSRLRLCMLGEGKFSKAVSLRDVEMGGYELQLLFDWQRPKRDLLVGDPVDERVLKFLAPHQREMVAAYRSRTMEEEKIDSMVPSTPPPDNARERREQEEREEEERRRMAATRIQTIARGRASREEVEERRSDRRMAMRMEEEEREREEEEEEQRKEKERDSDVEDITVLLWRKIFATHLNGKLVEVRLRVSSSSLSSTSSSSEKDLCVHVKIMEPKSRKIARIAVLGKQLSRLQRGSVGLDAARSNPESPLHDDVLEDIAIVQKKGQETTVACARAAANVFGALLLFQSRAQGLLLLKIKDVLLEEEDEGAEEVERSGSGGAKQRELDRARTSSLDASSLSHSPMMSPMIMEEQDDEGESMKKTNKKKSRSKFDIASSPPQPSAPKASNGHPLTFEDADDLGMEELEENVPIELLKQAAAKNWRPDSAVERPSDVPTLPLKQLKWTPTKKR